MVRKKNKLYTANRWNQPLFAQGVDREHNNIFDGMFSSTLNTPTSLTKTSGLFGQKSGLDINAPSLTQPNVYMPVDWSNKQQRKQALTNSKNMLNQFKADADKNNPFSQYVQKDKGLSSLASAGIGVGLNALDNIKIDGMRRGLWDAADPLYYLAGDKESTVGNGISDVGIETFKAGVQSGNPWVMLGGGVMKGIGSLVNAAWGMSTDKERLNAINQGNEALKNFTSDASYYDDITGPQATVDATGGVYKGGWFTKGKAARKNAELAQKTNDLKSYATRSVQNNIDNISQTQMDNLQHNWFALGGPLDQGSGAINYNFMSEYLTMRNKASENKNKVATNVFGNLPVTPLTTFALGGDIQTNGSDWSNGLTHIDAGGTHEQNPYQGVQVGINRENGNPDLVEEGETIFDDYVFSRRIKPDARTKKKFHVGKNSDISFADLSKKLEKESEERPNDAISIAGLTKQMHELADEQERQKEEQQKAEMEAAFAQLPPEQQQALMQQVAMQEQQAQQAEQPTIEGQQMPEEAMQQEQPQQQVDEQIIQQQPEMVQMEGQQGEVQMAACGGKVNRYDDGGNKGEAIKRKIYSFLPNIHTDSEFDKWAAEHNLDKIDWEKALENKQLVDAIGSSNPALGNVLKEGYNFSSYKAPLHRYDLDKFKKTLDDYTFSKNKGNTDGNYAIDKNFGLGKYKTIKELEDSPEYKAYTQYMVDALNRAKGVSFKYDGDTESYDNIRFKDKDKTISREDWEALRALQHHIDGTSTHPNGDVVPLWNKADADGYASLVDNASDLFTRYRTDGKGGIFHFTPDEVKRNSKVINRVINEDGSIEDIVGDVPTDWKRDSNYAWQTEDTDNVYNYYRRPAAKAEGTDAKGDDTEETLTPKHRDERLRYAGLLGPAVGLGMQMAGVGKPDYSGMEAAVSASSGAPAQAHTRYLGNYIGYNPMDIWYEQNRMNANSRATDRAILNNNSTVGTKMAGLLANSYNSQMASGNLFRQALEYNDAQRQKVADFNRGTDQFNASAFNQTSATNAQLQNNQRNFKAQMLMDAAKQRMASDAAWNQGIYGNVQGIFKGLSDLGRENAQHNMIADMAADGIFGNMSDRQYIGRNYVTASKTKKAKGGCVSRRKGRRGLTF